MSDSIRDALEELVVASREIAAMVDPGPKSHFAIAINAARAALAQPVEPVAWAITYRGAITQHFHNRETAGQEFGRMQATYPNDAALRALIPLYAAPQGPNSDAGAK